MSRRVLVFLFALAFVNVADGAGVRIGDTAPSFSALKGVDGKEHALADYKKDVVVLVITCNSCPVAQEYQERLVAFAKKYDGKLDLVALCVSIAPDDNLDKMKEVAKEQKFNFPYLSDPSQTIGRQLGAVTTPEFYVLDKRRKVVYHGAMDDQIDEKKVKAKYLEDAVDAVLKGEKVLKSETRSRGCAIEYSRK